MQITDYQFGKIEIEGHTYTADVIITPVKVIDSWWRKTGHRLAIEDLDEIVAVQPKCLVVGTGYYGRMAIPEETQRYLASKHIEIKHCPTGDAVKTFNQMQEQHSDVVAALHLTC